MDQIAEKNQAHTFSLPTDFQNVFHSDHELKGEEGENQLVAICSSPPILNQNTNRVDVESETELGPLISS